nr:hypothetical protein [Burkholderia pyrrocinia]
MRRFAVRHAEERRVETIDVVDETAVPAVARVAAARSRVVDGIRPAIGRHGADGVGAFREHRPERVGGIRAAGKTAAHADDRYRLVHRFTHVGQLASQRVDLQQRLLHGREGRRGRLIRLIHV